MIWRTIAYLRRDGKPVPPERPIFDFAAALPDPEDFRFVKEATGGRPPRLEYVPIRVAHAFLDGEAMVPLCGVVRPPERWAVILPHGADAGHCCPECALLAFPEMLEGGVEARRRRAQIAIDTTARHPGEVGDCKAAEYVAVEAHLDRMKVAQGFLLPEMIKATEALGLLDIALKREATERAKRAAEVTA